MGKKAGEATTPSAKLHCAPTMRQAPCAKGMEGSRHRPCPCRGFWEIPSSQDLFPAKRLVRGPIAPGPWTRFQREERKHFYREESSTFHHRCCFQIQLRVWIKISITLTSLDVGLQG